MRLRFVGGLALLGVLFVSPGRILRADDPTPELLKKAIEAAQSGEVGKGIGFAEKAVAAEPKNREAILLLGALTWGLASESDSKADRIKRFHQAGEILGRIPAQFKDVQPSEQMYLDRAKLGEARAYALEGKPKEALRLVNDLVKGGLDDLDMLDGEADLDSLRKLPEYAGLKADVLKQMRLNVVQALKDPKTYPFDFALKDLDDKPVKLADFKGKVTIVDVWGTWCPPCREEIPHFVALYKEWHAKGLEIVGINCNEDDNPKTARLLVKKFVADQKIPYPCVLNDEKTERKIPDFQGYPTTLFIDRTGKVRMTLVGLTARPKLQAIVETLLAEPATP